jgi:hypothetical protein
MFILSNLFQPRSVIGCDFHKKQHSVDWARAHTLKQPVWCRLKSYSRPYKCILKITRPCYLEASAEIASPADFFRIEYIQCYANNINVQFLLELFFLLISREEERERGTFVFEDGNEIRKRSRIEDQN